MIINGKYVFDERCAQVAEVLQLIGDKWSVLLIVLLAEKPRRFNELKRSIPGISQRMLTLTLRKLERDGIVNREVITDIPPFVNYELTNLGDSLTAPVRAICNWAEANLNKINSSRSRYTEKNSPVSRRSFARS